MAIKFTHGDLFQDQSEAIVNTVNCVGVMGKGVALRFKQLWPENYKKYKKICQDKQLRPGIMFTTEVGDMISRNKRLIINFPTKDHWRSKSKIEYIQTGLDSLANEIIIKNIKSIAMPPLGCGNGNLSWDEVKPLIEQKLSHLENVETTIYEPIAPRDTELEHSNTKDIRLTKERALLFRAIGEFEPYFQHNITKLCLQKLVYFFATLGYNFNVTFSKDVKGPYSQKLADTLRTLEENDIITGYSADHASIAPSYFASANDFLDEQRYEIQKVEADIEKISRLIQGYESPYGMELLATVHWIVSNGEGRSKKDVQTCLHNWSNRKKEMFDTSVIAQAYDRLSEDGFININP